MSQAAQIMHDPQEETLFNHPKGLFVLFFAEMWERFSYYGMRALLVLYMTGYLHFSTERAGGIYGDYTGFVYLTPLLGGFLADRYMGLRKAIIVGGVLMAIGHALMAVDALPFFYGALIFLIAGNGFFKPNISTLVGQLYHENDPRRDAGFTIFYMGINVGAFLAPLVCGTLGQMVSWHYGFGAAAIGMVLGLLVFLWGQKYFGDKGYSPAYYRSMAGTSGSEAKADGQEELEPLSSIEKLRLLAVAAAGVAFAGWSAFSAYGSVASPSWITAGRAALWPIAGSVVVGIWVFLMGRCHGDERKKVNAIFVLGLFVMVFWAAFEQAGSSLTLFADRSTLLNYFGFDFVASHFQSVNPLAIVLLAPVFSAVWTALELRGKNPSTPVKMAIGIFLNAAGFSVMVQAAMLAADGSLVSPNWLAVSYVLQTSGELCLSPIGLSMVTKLAPIRFASLLMGVWFLANAFANKLAGMAGGLYDSLSTVTLFGAITATLVVASLLLLAVTPTIKRWMGDVH